jgi:sodium-dependent dicarboxylate transporter 2/3/5
MRGREHSLSCAMSRSRSGWEKRQSVSLFLGPALFALACLSPTWPETSDLGMRTLGIFLWIVTWWIGEPIPLPATSFLAMTLLAVCGIMSPSRAFGYWAHWVNLFLIGAFLIGHAMNQHGVGRRFAARMLALRFIRGDPWRLLIVFLTAAALLSSVASNIAVTIVFMTLGIELLKSMRIEPGDRFGELLILGVAWAAGIGGIGTWIGTPPNLIAIGVLERSGHQVGFLQWILIGYPVLIAQLLVMFALLRVLVRPKELALRIPENPLGERPPLSRGEIVSVSALLTALALWMVPDLAPLLVGRHHWFSTWAQRALSLPVVSLLVASALFLIPLRWRAREFVLTWPEAVRGIEWGTLALIAAALALGDALGDPVVGLGRLFAQGAMWLTHMDPSPFLFVGLNVALATLLTQFLSNNAVISALGPLVLSISAHMSGIVSPTAVLVTVAMASSMAFALPSATPPVALVFASGYVRMPTLITYGALWSLISILVLTFVGYTIGALVL